MYPSPSGHFEGRLFFHRFSYGSRFLPTNKARFFRGPLEGSGKRQHKRRVQQGTRVYRTSEHQCNVIHVGHERSGVPNGDNVCNGFHHLPITCFPGRRRVKVLPRGEAGSFFGDGTHFFVRFRLNSSQCTMLRKVFRKGRTSSKATRRFRHHMRHQYLPTSHEANDRGRTTFLSCFYTRCFLLRKGRPRFVLFGRVRLPQWGPCSSHFPMGQERRKGARVYVFFVPSFQGASILKGAIFPRVRATRSFNPRQRSHHRVQKRPMPFYGDSIGTRPSGSGFATQFRVSVTHLFQGDNLRSSPRNGFHVNHPRCFRGFSLPRRGPTTNFPPRTFLFAPTWYT